MTDQTPRTEAGRALDFDTHGLFRKNILAIEAQARAEGLDVEVLEVAIERACADHNQDCWFRSSSRLGAEAILRAILAGETT